MLKKFAGLVVFCLCLQGCGTEKISSSDPVIEEDTEQDKIKTLKYFISVESNLDLKDVSDRFIDKYSSLIILDSFSSSQSLLVTSSSDDYSAIQELTNPSFKLTQYYEYNETNKFEEIVDWSRFYFSEQDSIQWKRDLDNLFYLSEGQPVSLTLAELALVGLVEKNTISTFGNRHIVVKLDGVGTTSYFTVHFGESHTSGSIYADGGYSLKYSFDGDFGYIMPVFELDYLQGALGLD